MSTVPAAFPNRVLLYHLDKRMSNNDYPRVEMKTFDLCRVHEFVSHFFSIQEEWATKVIERLLDEDVETYQLFELGRRDRPDIGYAIHLIGYTDEFRCHDSGIEYRPLRKNQSLSIRFKTDKLKLDHHVWFYDKLTYDELAAKKMDNSIVALYNSTIFNSLIESNYSGLPTRVVKVIDPVPSRPKL